MVTMGSRFSRIGAAVVVAFALVVASCSSKEDEAVAAREWSPETFTLDNGMEVVVLPDHRVPVVTHMVWYRVGAADEPQG